jgi:nucleobase:cation symporter-1, NCS1 family
MTRTDEGRRPAVAGAGIELTGIEVIDESERTGVPRSLFWPWFAANISVLGVSYGAFTLAFGVSFWQAAIAGVIGIVVSFALCGVIALAGKRGSAPTMVLSRAAFGVRGNRLTAVLSWLLTVGWETVLVVLATLATATVFDRLGWGGGTGTKVLALVVVSAITVLAGIAGFHLVMRLQAVITVVTAVLTVVYVVLVAGDIDLDAVSALPAGSVQQVIGALVFLMTGFGLGWVNAAADYSRYLPRRSSGAAVFGWTTFGGALGPVVLLIFGLLLAGSSPELSEAIGADPIGALTALLPTWFLVPFAIVAVGGLVSGAVLDIYSSGLTLLAIGLPTPRWVAAAIDGVLMILGTIYVVWIADNFLGAFQAFLITLGVPMAAWCGIFLADLFLRRRDYEEAKLFDPSLPGGYRLVRWDSVGLLILSTVVGWGLVIDSLDATDVLNWLGYLLGPFGLGGRDGDWAFSALGVLAALVIGFVGYLLIGRSTVRSQEEHQPPVPSRP